MATLTKFKISNNLPNRFTLSVYPTGNTQTIITTGTSNNVYIDGFEDATATFVTAGVQAGDYVYDITNDVYYFILVVESETWLTINASNPNTNVSYKIVRIAPVNIVLNQEYDFIDLMSLTVSSYIERIPGVQVVGVPLENFTYQIKDQYNVWSEDIICTVNRTVSNGTIVFNDQTIYLDETSSTDISNYFNFDNNTDRIIIDSIKGMGSILINNAEVMFFKTYMLYDFINVFFTTLFKNYAVNDNIHSQLKLRVGNINTLTTQKTISIILLVDAYLSDNNVIRNEALFYNEFYKEFSIKNGVPNASVIFTITPSITVTSLVVKIKGAEIASELTKVTTITSALDSEGRLIVGVSGVVPLTNSTDTYGFNLNFKLISVGGDVNNVNTILNALTIPVTSPEITSIPVNMLESISLLAPSIDSVIPAINYLLVNPDTGGSVDVLVVLNKVLSSGTEPFVYTITEDVASAVVITQQANPNEFLITGLTQLISNADTTDVSNKKYFTAQIEDFNNVISTLSFQIEAIDITTGGNVPVINSPTTFNVNVNSGSFVIGKGYQIVLTGTTDFTLYGANSNVVGTKFKATGVGTGTGIALLLIDVNEAVIYQVTATNNPSSFRAINLPTGISIDFSGLITGSVSDNTLSPFTLGLFASNNNGESIPAFSLSLAVTDPFSEILNTLVLNADTNQAISFQLLASNTPTSYSAVGLPVGLSLNTSTGLITGSVGVIGSTNVSVNATNAVGSGAVETLVITISAPVIIPIITSPLIVNANQGTFFSYTIIASNAPDSFNAWNLPTGVSFNGNIVSGKVYTAGTYSFNISATNSAGTDTEIVVLEIYEVLV